MTSARPHGRIRFSMKSLMIIFTVACLVLAIPKGYVLLITVFAQTIVVVATAKLLLVYNKPICRLLSGKSKSDG